MKMVLYDLPSSCTMTVNGVQRDLPLYTTEEEVPHDWYGTFATPKENSDMMAGWTNDYGHYADVGAMKMVTTQGTASRISVVQSMYPSQMFTGYAAAYEYETGQRYTGIAPIVILAALVIIAVAIATAVIATGLFSAICYAIDKSSEFQMHDVGTCNCETEGQCWKVICKGQNCQYFNTCDGAVKTGPEGDDLFSWVGDLTDVFKYGAIAIIAIVGLYGAIKIMGAMKSKKSESPPSNRDWSKAAGRWW